MTDNVVSIMDQIEDRRDQRMKDMWDHCFGYADDLQERYGIDRIDAVMTITHALLHGADKAIEHGVTEAEEIFELLRETLPQHFDRLY